MFSVQVQSSGNAYQPKNGPDPGADYIDDTRRVPYS
jgi:hypothetical protein